MISSKHAYNNSCKNKTMENEYGEYKNGDVAYFTYKSIAKVEKRTTILFRFQ